MPLAIVGNGGAAAEAVLALRAHGYAGDIHLFADNDEAPYNPMLGTYLISGAIPPERVFPFGDKRTFYGGNRVTAHLGSAVVSLDAETQTLVTAEGASYRYDRCLVATGARPSLPPVPGLREALSGEPESRRVFTLRSLEDALGLKNALPRLAKGPSASRLLNNDAAPSGHDRRARDKDAGSANSGAICATEDAVSRRPTCPGGRGFVVQQPPSPRAAVIGASLVGVKISALLRELGLRVRLIEREPHLLPLAAHPDCARMMEGSLLEDGYELMLGTSLSRVDAANDKVRLTFGPPGSAAETAEDFDLVVVCTGIRPSLAFLTPGQVETAAGILVDDQMRSSVPTLYAAGDVAQGMNLMSGRQETIALWASARYQGRAAGRSLAGAPGGYRGSIPSSISHVGRMLFASVGHLGDYDRLTAIRDGDTLDLRVWRDERLVGVNLLNCCLPAGAMKQALQKAACGATIGTEASWISFSG